MTRRAGEDDRRVSRETGAPTGPQFCVLPVALLRDPLLSDTAKLVAAELGSHMNRHGTCWPGEAIVAANTGRSVRTVRRAIQELVDRGHLTRHRRARLTALLTWTAPMTGHVFGRSPTAMTGQPEPDDRPNDPTMTGHMVASQRPRSFASMNEVNGNRQSLREEEKASRVALPERMPGETTADYLARTVPGFRGSS